MRFVLGLAVACVAIGLASTQPAHAQFPVYAPQSYGYAPQSYGYAPQSYGQVHCRHDHDGHYQRPATSQYYSGYGAPHQYPRSVGYPPAVNYPPVYGGGTYYAQPSVPQNPIYYSNNNYYGSQTDHLHHPWHPGHYLLGHH